MRNGHFELPALLFLLVEAAAGVYAGLILGVPPIEDGIPLVEVFHADELLANLQSARVRGGVFDPELAHRDPGSLRSIELFGEPKVFEHDLALLVDARWSGQGLAIEDRLGLAEDPWIADASSGDGHAIDAGFEHHAQAVLGAEQIAASEDDFFLADMLFDFFEERPAARSDVALFDGSSVDGDPSDAIGKCTIEDLVKVVTALLGVIDPSPHFDRHGYFRRDDIACSANDFQGDRGLAQVKSTSASAEYFANRAAKVDIDDAKAGFDELLGTEGELLGFGSHELAGHGMFFGRVVQKVLGLFAFFEAHEELIEHDFAQRVRCAHAACDEAHGPIAVATQGSLDDRKTDIDVADAQRGDA